jgi:hypothetical protein
MKGPPNMVDSSKDLILSLPTSGHKPYSGVISFYPRSARRVQKLHHLRDYRRSMTLRATSRYWFIFDFNKLRTELGLPRE